MEFLLIAGSYERLLYGLEARCASPSDDLPSRKFELKSAFIFPAHNGSIKCIASGSDQFLASGSTDELIRLFDLKKRKELGTLIKHEGSITCLEFFQKSHLLSGSEDGTLAIWRTSDWECLKVLKGHSAAINDMAIHPSGRLVMTVGKDCSLRIWNLLKGHQAACKKLPYEPTFVSYSPNASHFCVLSDAMIQLFPSTGDAATFTIDNKPKKYISATFYGSHHLALGSEHGTIDIYEFESSRHCITIEGHRKRIRSLATVQLKDTARYLFSASTDGMIRGWDLQQYIGKNEMSKLDVSHCIAEYNTSVRLTCLNTVVPANIQKSVTVVQMVQGDVPQKRKLKEVSVQQKKRLVK